MFVKKHPLIGHVTPSHFTAGLGDIKKIEKAAQIKVEKKKKKGKGKQKEKLEVEDDKPEQEIDADALKKQPSTLQKPNYPFARKIPEQFRVSK